MDNLNQTNDTMEKAAAKLSPKEKRKKLPKKNYPTQDRINFALIGVEQMKLSVIIPAIVLIVLCAGVFGKIFVADRFAKVYRLSSEVSALESRIAADEEEIASYGELEKQFAHYTYSGMTADEIQESESKQVAFGTDAPFVLAKNATKGGAANAVDAITGATMTSKGLNEALNVWFKAYEKHFNTLKAEEE